MHRFRSWLLDPPEYRTQRNRLLPIEGGDGSTLNLDFTTGVLDSRLTFSRLNNATFIDNSGIIKHCVQNLFYNTNWVASSLPSGWLLNPASNGSYTWNNNGTVTFNTTTGQRQFIYPDFPYITTTPGLPYTCGFKVISTTNNPVFGEVFVEGGTNGTLSGIVRKINGSTTVIRNGLPETVSNSTVILDGDVLEITVINSNTQWYPRIGLGVNIGTPAARSITVTQPQANNGTTLQTYTPNTNTATGYFGPRFDHDPTTGTPKGLLIEGAANNIVLNGSMAYTATAPTSWVRGFSGCTVASVDSTTFLGQKAWSISATASGQRDILEQVISLAANTTYTVSVYLEAVTGTPATFAYMTGFGAGATSGTIVNPSVGRVSFTVTVGATPVSGTLRIGIGSATGTGVSADASVRFSHVQVEAGSVATSYIPTGGSTGNRTAESLSLSPSTWYSPAYAEGTFYFRGSILNTATGYTRLFALTASSSVGTATGTVANFNIGVAASNSNRPFLNTFNTSNNDVDIYVPVGAAVSNNVEFGVTAAYKSGDWRISSKNLAATSTYATVSYATWGNNLFLFNVNGISMPAVWYKQFKFYPIRLPNSQMDILSA